MHSLFMLLCQTHSIMLGSIIGLQIWKNISGIFNPIISVTKRQIRILIFSSITKYKTRNNCKQTMGILKSAIKQLASKLEKVYSLHHWPQRIYQIECRVFFLLMLQKRLQTGMLSDWYQSRRRSTDKESMKQLTRKSELHVGHDLNPFAAHRIKHFGTLFKWE